MSQEQIVKNFWKRLSDVPKFSDKADRMAEKQPRKYRAVVAVRGLEEAYSEAGLDPESAIVDMLSDLRHLCDALGLSFSECDGTAHGHYTTELQTKKEYEQSN